MHTQRGEECTSRSAHHLYLLTLYTFYIQDGVDEPLVEEPNAEQKTLSIR